MDEATLESFRKLYESVPISPLVPVQPTPKQRSFMANMGKESLYGGTARSAKSYAALMAASQYFCVPGYSALILRRKRVSLELPDGLIDIAHQWFDKKASWSGDRWRWTFPSGATLTFGYIDDRTDLLKYHSSAYQFILFEEVAEWVTMDEYSYMFSRLTPKVDHDNVLPRCQCHGWSVADVPLRMRATANPGGPGQGWVRENFILPWRDGAVGLFHPASYKDNPYIDHAEYERTVEKMRAIDRERILGGNWDITAPGERFARMWFKPMPRRQMLELLKDPSTKWVRWWDMAGTRVKKANKDPDWTVGALVGFRETEEGEQWLIFDIERFRDTAGGVIRKMKVKSKGDDKLSARHLPIRVEREPGVQARMAMAKVKQEHFKGYNWRAKNSKISKEDRIDVLSVAAEVGWEAGAESTTGVFYVEGAEWAQRFLDEADAYGNPGVHDDQVDAVSGAMIDISKGGGGSVGARRGERESADAEETDSAGYPALAGSSRSVSMPRSSMAGIGYDGY